MLRLATPMSVLAVAGASFALAACGSSSSDDISSAKGGTASSGQSGTPNADFQKFQQCLKDNGVTLPDRGGQGSQGGPPPQKAMQACAKYRPQRNGAPRQDIRTFTAYLTCLKDAGLDVKVADGFNALRNLEQSDPKVQAALKSCQSKLPQRPQGAPSGTAPGNTTTNGTT